MANKGIPWKRLWIYAVLIILFVLAEVNVVMWAEKHMTEEVVYHQSDAMKNIYKKEGYNIVNNHYTAISDDPYIFVKSKIPSANRVVIKFGDELRQSAKLQVYYQVQGAGIHEHNSSTVYIQAGEEEAVVDFPLNKYSDFRLDIDGDFELKALDLYAIDAKDSLFIKFIIRLLAILIFAGVIVFLYKKHHAKSAYRRQEDVLQRFLVIYVPAALLAFIFLNSLNTNSSTFERYIKTEGNLVKEVNGYIETEEGYQRQQGEECSLILAGGDDVDKVLLDVTAVENRDINIEYWIIDKYGFVGEKKEMLWEQGRGAVIFDLERQSYRDLAVAIPADFSLDQAFYIRKTENSENTYVYHLIVQLILIISAALFIRIDIGKQISYRCIHYLRDIQHRAVKNRKKILICLAAFAGITLLGMAVLEILCLGKICRWNMKSFLFCVMVSWMAAALLFLNKYFTHKVENIGFIMILLAGSIFALIAPANVGLSWDDQIHYEYSADLSSMGGGEKVYSETILDEYVYIPQVNYDWKMQQNSYRILDTLEKEGCYGAKRHVNWTNLSTWIPYIPSAAGIIAARGLNLPFHVQVIFGRWMNVLLWAVLCYFAMRSLRKGKIVVLFVALIPTNIFIASNYTYDTCLTGWSILGISLFMGELQRIDKKITVQSMIAIAGSMCLAVMPKMVYFPITLMVLFMPKVKFQTKKQQYGYYGLVIGAMLLPFVLLYINTFGRSGGAGIRADTRGGEKVSAQGQIDYIKSHFGTFARTLYLFLRRYLNPIANGGFLSYFAYVSEPSGASNHLVLWTIVVGALFHHEDDAKIPWWYRAGTLCVYVSVGMICAVSMYIMFTPVGAEDVAGCQGRYLLPAIFPLVYTLTRIPLTGRIKAFMEEKGLTRAIDVILVSSLLCVSVAVVWNCYVMPY